jgi:RNA polymerase sigma-70 factor (ECF subfamily)
MCESECQFEQIYNDFRAKIQRYLSSLVGEDEAEDLTQEVFIKVRQALQTFRGESELGTWIYRIARHVAIDLLRSPAQRWMAPRTPSNGLIIDDWTLDIPDQNAWTGAETPAIEQQISRHEMEQCLADLIARLPENYRTVLVLSELEGAANQTIADILGMSLDTVKIRLHRARQRLVEEVEAHCPSYWVDGDDFLPEIKRDFLQAMLAI